MEKSEIQRILSAPICSLSCSTEEEKKVFADKKEGYFYTFELASGQRLIGHLFSQNSSENGSKSKKVFSFRPLNRMLPDLEEFCWIKEDLHFIAHGVKVRVLLNDSGADKKELIYDSVLRPKPLYQGMLFEHHPLYNKALNLYQALTKCEEAQKNLIEAQEKLKQILSPQKESQLIQQKKLNERRQNG